MPPEIQSDYEKSRRQLVERMKWGHALSPEIERAFLAVPREEFVTEEYRSAAYVDSALPLMNGATISQPSMLAVMLEELRLRPGMSVLEAGSGCGYFLALLAEMGAKPIGVEIIEDLAAKSRETLAKLGYDIEVITGDAAKVKFLQPFDRVVFSAAVSEIPQWSRDLLAPGGFVLAPVGTRGEQELLRCYADRQEWTGRRCRFVPFV